MSDDQDFPSLRSPTARQLMRDGMTLPDGTVVFPSQNALERIESEVGGELIERVAAADVYLGYAQGVAHVVRPLLDAIDSLHELAAMGLSRDEEVLRDLESADEPFDEALRALRYASTALAALVARIEAFDMRGDPIQRALDDR